MMVDIEHIIDLTKKKKLPKIGVIIQARMTSSRFRGKSMYLLQGLPVIEHVIRNCKLIKPITNVILACPDTPESEPMVQLASKLEIDNFCGAEYDVLDRYVKAARFFDLDIIVRVTGDCPFINPNVCSEVLNLLLWRKLDYCSNIYPIRSYPKGLDCEVFTRDCLEACFVLSDAIPNPGEIVSYDHEHVTPWMQKCKDLKKANVAQKDDVSHINLCVDYPEDIARLETYKFMVSYNDNK